MSQPLRIAVADDELDMRDYYARILPRLGHQVVAVASTGRELVECCRLTIPDLVISDVKMPDMDGIEAVMRISEQRPVPVILVSAYRNSDLLRQAEIANVIGYLVKPIRQSDLEPLIAEAARLAQARGPDHEAL